MLTCGTCWETVRHSLSFPEFEVLAIHVDGMVMGIMRLEYSTISRVRAGWARWIDNKGACTSVGYQ